MTWIGEFRPGAMEAILASTIAKSGAANRAALGAVARAVETETKTELGKSTHPYAGWGARTTARAGGPPALVSGTLRRSMTHTPVVLDPFGLMTKVGTGVGFYPWYGKGRTPSSEYGRYLETGLSNGAKYPFLVPTATRVTTDLAPQIWRTYFREV